jgi:predicted ester cyclase
MSIEENKAAVQKFIDGLNQQNGALLAEAATPEVATEWTAGLPDMYARMKDHRIDITMMVAEGDMVAVKLATRGYHTGELHGLAATGKPWTNRVYVFFRFVDGKIAEVDTLADAENIIKQMGGVITPVAV